MIGLGVPAEGYTAGAACALPARSRTAVADKAAKIFFIVVPLVKDWFVDVFGMKNKAKYGP